MVPPRAFLHSHYGASCYIHNLLRSVIVPHTPLVILRTRSFTLFVVRLFSSLWWYLHSPTLLFLFLRSSLRCSICCCRLLPLFVVQTRSCIVLIIVAPPCLPLLFSPRCSCCCYLFAHPLFPAFLILSRIALVVDLVDSLRSLRCICSAHAHGRTRCYIVFDRCPFVHWHLFGIALLFLRAFTLFTIRWLRCSTVNLMRWFVLFPIVGWASGFVHLVYCPTSFIHWNSHRYVDLSSGVLFARTLNRSLMNCQVIWWYLILLLFVEHGHSLLFTHCTFHTYVDPEFRLMIICCSPRYLCCWSIVLGGGAFIPLNSPFPSAFIVPCPVTIPTFIIPFYISSRHSYTHVVHGIVVTRARCLVVVTCCLVITHVSWICCCYTISTSLSHIWDKSTFIYSVGGIPLLFTCSCYLYLLLMHFLEHSFVLVDPHSAHCCFAHITFVCVCSHVFCCCWWTTFDTHGITTYLLPIPTSLHVLVLTPTLPTFVLHCTVVLHIYHHFSLLLNTAFTVFILP